MIRTLEMTTARDSVACSALALLLLAGCASSSVGHDVARVEELTRVEHLARVADTDVDPASSEEARKLLKQGLDADSAVRVALLNNRELRATLRELGVTRGRVLQAGLLPNPRAEAELLPERNSQYSLRVEYDVTQAVLAPMRSRAAGPELEAARYRAAAGVVDLGYRVRTAFYRLQSAQQRLAIAAQVLEAAAASREAARAMLAAGNVPALDAATQDAAYERERIGVAELELEVETERERVQRLLGVYGEDALWSVKSELAALPERASVAIDLEARALRASFELMEGKQHLLALERKAGVARTAGWLPDAIFDVHALRGNGDPNVSGGPTPRDFRYGAGVNLSIPLFDRDQGAAAALEAEFNATLERYYGTAIEVRSAARAARARVLSAHARARQYQTVILPAEQRINAETLLQYNAMQLGIFQLLQARREQLDVQLRYVETLREYWSAVAELDALLAGRHAREGMAGAANAMPAQDGSGGGGE